MCHEGNVLSPSNRERQLTWWPWICTWKDSSIRLLHSLNFTFRCFPLSQVVIRKKCFILVYCFNTETKRIFIQLKFYFILFFFRIWSHQITLFCQNKHTRKCAIHLNFSVPLRLNIRDDCNKKIKSLCSTSGLFATLEDINNGVNNVKFSGLMVCHGSYSEIYK